MWPWEHFSVSYLSYSVAVRATRRRPPNAVEGYALLFGALFPDLIDKPASWLFQIFPSGVSVAHSIFVAVPFTILVLLVSRRLGRTEFGTGFGVAYLLHLPQDAVYGTITSGSAPAYRVFLWPIAPKQTSSYGGFLANVRHYFGQYQALLADPWTVWFVLFEVLLLSAALSLWIADGAPGWNTVSKRLPTKWLAR